MRHWNFSAVSIGWEPDQTAARPQRLAVDSERWNDRRTPEQPARSNKLLRVFYLLLINCTITGISCYVASAPTYPAGGRFLHLELCCFFL